MSIDGTRDEREYQELQDQNRWLMEENDRLHMFATLVWDALTQNAPSFTWEKLRQQAKELGLEVDSSRLQRLVEQDIPTFG